MDIVMVKKRFTEARLRAGYTLKRLSEESGVNKSSIQMFGSLNNTRLVNTYSLYCIAKTLNISVDWLLGLKEEK